jgi:transposase
MIKDELVNTLKNWNSETESVNVLKTAFEACGKSTEELCEDDDIWDLICYLQWAEKYYELSFNTPLVEENNIMVIDHSGDCLCYDFQVKNVSELKI